MWYVLTFSMLSYFGMEIITHTLVKATNPALSSILETVKLSIKDSNLELPCMLVLQEFKDGFIGQSSQ